MSPDHAEPGAVLPPDKPSDKPRTDPDPVKEGGGGASAPRVEESPKKRSGIQDRPTSPQDAHDAVGETSVAGEEDPGAAIDVETQRAP